MQVCILGATGLVGQKYIELLQGDERFRIVELSSSRPGPYGSVVDWQMQLPLNPEVASIVLQPPVAANFCARICFSTLDEETERAFAAQGCLVFSSGSWGRMAQPTVMPFVNLDAAPSTLYGSIISKVNCVAAGLSVLLHVARPAWASALALQSLSGGGIELLSRGAARMAPVPGEAAKVERETRFLLGWAGPLRVRTLRVPVAVGHSVWLTARFAEPLCACTYVAKCRVFNDWVQNTHGLEETIRVRCGGECPCGTALPGRRVDRTSSETTNGDATPVDMPTGALFGHKHAIRITSLVQNDPCTLTLLATWDNLDLGAAGSALILARYFYNRL